MARISQKIARDHREIARLLQHRIEGRSIREELILSNPLPERAVLHRILPRGYISQYTP